MSEHCTSCRDCTLGTDSATETPSWRSVVTGQTSGTVTVRICVWDES